MTKIRTRASEGRRRLFAELAILIVFVMLTSQAFAASRIASPVSNRTIHGESPALAMPRGMRHDGADTPCMHHVSPRDLACCLSAHCSLLPPWLAATAPVLLPAGLIEFSYENIIPALPHRLAPAPAVPPPRHQV